MSFCGGLLLLLFASVLPVGAVDQVPAHKSSTGEYRLRMHHTHTGEDIDVVYRRGDNYVPEALAELNHFLRDHRTGEVAQYDPKVFDLLYDLEASLGRTGVKIDVICGYRTQWSNDFLRTHGHGVAAHSLHMEAKAIDIRIPGSKLKTVRDTALALQEGGVGYYKTSDFVHVDVGRVRRW